MKPNIGENIKKLRNEKQVTQEQLAEHLCISYQAISKWENNVTMPDIFLLPKIAEYFEVPIDELFKVNMTGYKNKAARLFALYDFRQTKENFDKAEAEFEKLIAENNADSDDINTYGMLNKWRSDNLAKKAEELFRQAISQGSEHGAEWQLLVLLSERGRHKENIDRYEELVKNNPDKARNWYLLAYVYSGHYGGINAEKAFEIAKTGVEKFPNDAKLLNLCGDICRGLKKYDEAFDYYKKSIEQDPNVGDNYFSMAFTYTELKKYKDAIWAWEEVIALYGRLGMCDEGIEMGIEWPKKEIAKLQALLGNDGVN